MAQAIGNLNPQRASNQTWDTITDKRILTLNPKVQVPAFDFVNEVEATLLIKLRVTQALRTISEQNSLYAQGRTTQGSIVTNAKGGESYHNYGLALDVVEIDAKGSPVWQTNWTAISQIGIKHGFDWGGSWPNTPDKPHFQMTFGLTIKQLQNGVTP